DHGPDSWSRASAGRDRARSRSDRRPIARGGLRRYVHAEAPAMKVALLMGGRSAEREISLRTGQGIARSLRQLGHDVVAVDAANGRVLTAGDEERATLPETGASSGVPTVHAVADVDAVQSAEIVFVALHGGAGE